MKIISQVHMEAKQVLMEVLQHIQRRSNMKTIYLSTLIFMVLSCNTQSQELIPLSKFEGSYMESGWLIVPKLEIKKDSNAILYHKEKPCFIPENDFLLCIYEVFSDRYIVITPIDENKKENSAIFVFPKNKIKIYSLSSGKIYNVDIKSKKIINVIEDEKKVIVV